MKICIYGAGAVGGHVAARLAQGGAEVSLVARGAQLAALREHGLEVQTATGVLRSHPVATDRPGTLGRQDFVIVAMKAQSLPHLTDGIAPLLGPETPVVFMTNGIPWWYFQSHGGSLDGSRLDRLDPEGKLWDCIKPRRVVGAVAYTASTVTAPGKVYAGNPRNRVILGRPAGQVDPQLAALAELMRAGGLDAEVTASIRDAVWAKLVMNLVGGALGILTASAMGQALADPVIAAAAEAAAREAGAVATALGCTAGDIEGGLARLKISTHKQSILQDLELGRAMEVDALLVEPRDFARKAGVATPTLDLIVALAVQRARAAGLYKG